MGIEKTDRFKLVGFKNFTLTNLHSDLFPIKRFHHIEFWCGDATNTARRFSWGLGIPIVAKSGNSTHASYLLNFLFTAPYSPTISTTPSSSISIPSFSVSSHRSFTATHGLGVRAIALEVENAHSDFTISVVNGAKPVSEPVILSDQVVIAEVHLYGDVVLGFVSYLKDSNSNRLFVFLPAESGLNSVVLANNDETVLLPLNEPVYGTQRKNQIQMYLEHNEGAGVQHLALVTEDIFRTLREMRRRSGIGGFEFMPSPPPTYYKNLKSRAGDILSDEQIHECEELEILVDRDDQGTLLQIFTKQHAYTIYRNNPENRVHAEKRGRRALSEGWMWRLR
ncbi:hypothetical protein K7X08_028167 [Anisodus acutangulus]|uniref:4-hydroxyphenylpyruvate dioxygenase n=1 Tax=Anisodus acutangulus TaxID=402998 RepID=A0A9Q1RRE1_9SOLA|nr:hypothetical protein K7X08_028167 [Anisodus acutangulus]